MQKCSGIKTIEVRLMTSPLPVINIKAQSSHHALFLMLLAAVILVITLLLDQGYQKQNQLVFIFIYLTALVIFITGLAKHLQPQFSLKLSPKGIKYKHNSGHWRLDWQQIQRIALVKESYGIEQLQLPYIGIKLCNFSSLAKQISPRLANRLIHEQRPLIAMAIKLQLLTFEQSQLNFSPYILTCGTKVKGPLAAFLHHSAMLYSAFGYHLFIPESALDRELSEFEQLLSQCKQSSKKYQ